MESRPFNGPQSGEPVGGTWAADEACDQRTGTPGTCGLPGPSTTPSTDVSRVVFGGCAATAFPAGAPPIQLTTVGTECHLSDRRTYTPDVPTKAATVEPTSGPHTCSQQALSMPTSTEPARPPPAPLSAAGLQPFAELMFASGAGEPVDVEGEFGQCRAEQGARAKRR